MRSARDSPAAAAFASSAAASARLMAMLILMLRGSPNMAALRPLFGLGTPRGCPAPGRAPPRPDFFGAGFFSVVLARDIFRGAVFYFWELAVARRVLKPFVF